MSVVGVLGGSGTSCLGSIDVLLLLCVIGESASVVLELELPDLSVLELGDVSTSFALSGMQIDSCCRVGVNGRSISISSDRAVVVVFIVATK